MLSGNFSILAWRLNMLEQKCSAKQDGSRTVHRLLEKAGKKAIYTKYPQIKRPADNYVFVEEQYKRRSSDISWHIDNDHRWDSNLALWHNNKIILGFTDLHVETHKLEDKRIILYHSGAPTGNTGATQMDNPDLAWLWERFPCHEWVKDW
jgi:hypothetical protein